ncbi:GntR family transcriptional regulator [Mameliella alba]|uniref:GntR family transcriptional regulator n=1 Tax=Mameliella alba TaxID=561184 RepID=UPI002434179C|nr:FCD domain-containing protein [Mameliella alba]
MTREELAELEARHEACRQLAEEERTDDYNAENSAFHACIYRATHNGFIAKEAMRLHAMLQPYRRIQLQVRNRVKRSFEEHEAVVTAIRNGDDAAAEKAMRDHVLVQGDRFHDMLAALRSDSTHGS